VSAKKQLFTNEFVFRSFPSNHFSRLFKTQS